MHFSHNNWYSPPVIHTFPISFAFLFKLATESLLAEPHALGSVPPFCSPYHPWIQSNSFLIQDSPEHPCQPCPKSQMPAGANLPLGLSSPAKPQIATRVQGAGHRLTRLFRVQPQTWLSSPSGAPSEPALAVTMTGPAPELGRYVHFSG